MENTADFYLDYWSWCARERTTGEGMENTADVEE
jgi:hypothetical protein